MRRVICETMRKQSVRVEEAAPYVSAFLPFVSVPVSGRVATRPRCARAGQILHAACGTPGGPGRALAFLRRDDGVCVWLRFGFLGRHVRDAAESLRISIGRWDGLGRHVAKTSVFRRDAAVAQCLTRADATTRARPLHNSTLLNSTIVSIHTLFDDHESTTTSTNPKSIPLEAHAPPQHLILRAL